MTQQCQPQRDSCEMGNKDKKSRWPYFVYLSFGGSTFLISNFDIKYATNMLEFLFRGECFD